MGRGWEIIGVHRLTPQEVGGHVWPAVGAHELPVKVILLALAVLAQAGVGVFLERAACGGGETTTSDTRLGGTMGTAESRLYAQSFFFTGSTSTFMYLV